MNRLTDHDQNYGPITIGPWKGTFSIDWETSDGEDLGQIEYNTLRIVGFGWAMRLTLPYIIPSHKVKIQANWDEETNKRLGRNWYYDITPRRYGISLSNMGNGYDFFQIHYGNQTHSSNTDQTWSKHLPWKMWRCVRSSIYNPDGSHFATEEKGKFFDFLRIKEKCPTTKYLFEDYDGSQITATCIIEEREWHRGEGWFKWLKYFYPKKIRRSLDIAFSAEVGPEKGSWKGGTTGHGIDMLSNETPTEAFQRYCSLEHSARRNRKYNIKFLKAL